MPPKCTLYTSLLCVYPFALSLDINGFSHQLHRRLCLAVISAAVECFNVLQYNWYVQYVHVKPLTSYALTVTLKFSSSFIVHVHNSSTHRVTMVASTVVHGVWVEYNQLHVFFVCGGSEVQLLVPWSMPILVTCMWPCHAKNISP